MTTTHSHETASQNLSLRVVNERAFKFVLRIGIIAIVILGIGYIKLSSSLATRGFKLEELKNKRIELTQKLEKIEIQTTIPTSLYALRSSEIVQNMPSVKKQKFLQVMAGQVAMK